MTEILAITAFLIAFGTVFLVSDALRKTERRQDAALKSFSDKLKIELNHNAQIIRELQEEMKEFNDVAKLDSGKATEMQNRLKTIDAKLANLDSELDGLNQMLGPKFRKAPRKSA